MLAKDAFEDIRNYIKQRIAYAVYYIGNETQEVNLTSVEILDNGAVRVMLSISSNSDINRTVRRIELYNTEKKLWAFQNCFIKITPEQPGLLYWFDFEITERELK